MSIAEIHLAILAERPRHGYEVKQEHDAWFAGGRPIAFGQVYATLARLVRDGLAEVVETRQDGGPEKTVYAMTDAGRERLRTWLGDPAPASSYGADDVVRKTVVALKTAAMTGGRPSAREVVLRQRAAHLRLMHDLHVQVSPASGEPIAQRLGRRHTLLHLDADLRWLEEAADALALSAGSAREERT